MKKKINKQLIWQDLAERILQFFPFFIAFYGFSLVLSFFFAAWKVYFYWPALHIAAICFTLIFFWEVNLYQKIMKQSLEARNTAFTKVMKGMPFFGRASTQVLGFFLTILRIIYPIVLSVFLVLKELLKKEVQRVNNIPWTKVLVIKLLCIGGVLFFALYQGAPIIDFLILGYGLASVLFRIESRYAAGAALFFLALCPIVLLLKKDAIAESLAVYAYYFLVITVVTQLRELKREGKEPGDITFVDNSEVLP